MYLSDVYRLLVTVFSDQSKIRLNRDFSPLLLFSFCLAGGFDRENVKTRGNYERNKTKRNGKKKEIKRKRRTRRRQRRRGRGNREAEKQRDRDGVETIRVWKCLAISKSAVARSLRQSALPETRDQWATGDSGAHRKSGLRVPPGNTR